MVNSGRHKRWKIKKGVKVRRRVVQQSNSCRSFKRHTSEKLLKGFLALPYVEVEKENWIKAGKLVSEFKRLPLEEGLLCALSQRENLKILTKNKEI